MVFFGHGVNQFDDTFGLMIRRGRLTGKNNGPRYHRHIGIGPNAMVKGDHVQHIEQLALVLMDSFDLYRKQGVRVDTQTDFTQDITGQAFFVVPFGLDPASLKLGILGQWFQFFSAVTDR